MTVIALYSMKGGVGKTAAAVNLAYEAALTGCETLLCDLDIARVEMPGFTLQRDGESLRVENLDPKEQTNEQAAGALLESLATLRIDGLLGTEPEPDYHLDKPDLEVKVTRKDGDVLDYRFSKPAKASYYVLKRSDLGDYFKVTEFSVKPIRDDARDKLVQAKVAAEAKPEPPVQHARADIVTRTRSR